ncbi:unnamed protein product [Cylicostephanus goldi]|uniref:Uncharacterized protein n=1 Tax=Cylicostephanus goldi TaxID=71465 RepID=A0A3P6S2C2_CYLGO|nr:unnamed protein product [Cylicostephanus goldi]
MIYQQAIPGTHGPNKVTSTALVQAYIHRIDQVNGIINAVVVRLFDEAIKKATEVDREIAEMNDERLAEVR